PERPGHAGDRKRQSMTQAISIRTYVRITARPKSRRISGEEGALAALRRFRIEIVLGPLLAAGLQPQRFGFGRAFHRRAEAVVVDQPDRLDGVGRGDRAVAEGEQVVAVLFLSPAREVRGPGEDDGIV